jgi:hypothetical protein
VRESVQLTLSRSGRIVQLKQQFAADSAAHDALSAEAIDAHSSGSGGRSVAKSLETSSLQFHSTRLLASEDFLHDEIINEQFTRYEGVESQLNHSLSLSVVLKVFVSRL